MNPENVIFICDGDPDNLLAGAWLAETPEAKLLGVFTVHGFESAGEAAEQLRDVLPDSVPVCAACELPLTHGLMPEAKRERAPEGETVRLAEASRRFAALAEAAGEVTVILSGAATFLCGCLDRFPALNGTIRRVVFIGGSYMYGTVKPNACHHVYFDTEAFQSLTHRRLKVEMIPLDVTGCVEEGLFLQDYLAGEQAPGADLAVALYACLPADPARQLVRAPYGAVAALHPELCGMLRCKCEAERNGTLTYGMTVVYRNHFAGVITLPDGGVARQTVPEGERNIDYCSRLDTAAAEALWMPVLRNREAAR